MGDIKPGDRIRVTKEFEVEVRYASRDQQSFDVTYDNGAMSPSVSVDRDGVVAVKKIEAPAEVFKPGDRIRRKDDYLFQYEVTLGASGYIHHGASDSFSQYGSWGIEGEGFTSDRYEKVNLGD
jgi:hypothetical protein